MRMAVFSDVHANLQALEAFERAARHAGVDTYVSLGDTVGYGGNPIECLEWVKTLTLFATPFKNGDRDIVRLMIRGNHDDAVGSGRRPEHFNGAAASAVVRHIEVMTESQKEFLYKLPLTCELNEEYGKTLFVHGSPMDPADYNYILHVGDAIDNLEHLAKTGFCLAFTGHTHSRPVGYVARGAGLFFPKDTTESRNTIRWGLMKRLDRSEDMYRTFKIEEGDIALVNVGSVGQPRDHNPKGAFVVFDNIKMTIEIIRFDYDIAAAQKAIRDIGNNDRLAERLVCGV